MNRHGWVLALLALALSLVTLLAPVVQNGDAASYNAQIETGDFGPHPQHIGYLLFGYVFCKLVPGGTDWLMNLFTLLVGTAGALGVFAIARSLRASGMACFMAAVALFGVPRYMLGTLTSEVDVPMAAACVVALSLWLRGRDTAAAAVFALAMLVTPLSAVGLPAFLVTATLPTAGGKPASRARPLGRLLVFALVSSAIFAPIVIFRPHDYFYGSRGVLSAGHGSISVAQQWAWTVRFFVAQPWLALTFAAGIVAGFVRGFWRYAVGVVATFVTTTLFGQRFSDVPVHLVTTAYAAPLVAVLVEWALEAWNERTLAARLAAGSALALLAVIVVESAATCAVGSGEFVAAALRERASYRRMQSAFDDELVLVESRNFDQTGRFTRALPPLSKGRRVLTRRAFDQDCAALAEGPRRTFILNRAPFSAPCEKMNERYEAVSRRFGGHRVKFLVPKDGSQHGVPEQTTN